MSHNARMFIITGIMSVLFGGSIVILFAHALERQQIVMQEGY